MSALAFLLLLAQRPIPADAVSFDMQCMMATQIASEQLEGAERAAMAIAAMFYFGRVDSILGGAELERRLSIEAKKIEGQQLGPLLTQCGQFMEVRGKNLEEIGARLDAEAERPPIN